VKPRNSDRIALFHVAYARAYRGNDADTFMPGHKR
jgi:hypothetical protein